MARSKGRRAGRFLIRCPLPLASCIIYNNCNDDFALYRERRGFVARQEHDVCVVREFGLFPSTGAVRPPVRPSVPGLYDECTALINRLHAERARFLYIRFVFVLACDLCRCVRLAMMMMLLRYLSRFRCSFVKLGAMF